jgi:hypothetical protein
MHYVTRRSHRMQKHKSGVTCPTGCPFEHEKECIDILRTGCTGMHYVTNRSHRMQQGKFCIMCPGALFMETAPGHPEHEKDCVDVSCPRHTGMYYVTRRSHRMRKHNFGVMCPSALFVISVESFSSMKSSALMFHATDAPKCTR